MITLFTLMKTKIKLLSKCCVSKVRQYIHLHIIYKLLVFEAEHIIYLLTGLSREIRGFSIAKIIPPSDYYITYEGSITQPSCQETVTWVVINKPLHISKNQVSTYTCFKIFETEIQYNFELPSLSRSQFCRTLLNST